MTLQQFYAKSHLFVFEMDYQFRSVPPLSLQSARLNINKPGIHDLQDYTFPIAPYAPVDPDEFGFDPPNTKPVYPELDQTYTPLDFGDGLSLSRWPGFVRGNSISDSTQESDQMCGIKKLILPGAVNAITRFGQVTPPRTNSISSSSSIPKNIGSASPKALEPGHKPRPKPQRKEIKTPAPKLSRRKRRQSAKGAINTAQAQTPEDAKRKTSLEKNRLAAAKCRIRKKENTEKLQQDSYDKVVLNSFLQDQVTCMKGEIQQMNVLLLAHANCAGCMSPEEIQKHIRHMGDEFLAQEMFPAGHMQLDDTPLLTSGPVIEDGYFEALRPK